MYLVHYERKLWIIEKPNESKKKKPWNCSTPKTIVNDNRKEIQVPRTTFIVNC